MYVTAIFRILVVAFVVDAVIMFLISWMFTVVSLALASLIYYYVSIKGKAGDWGDGFKSAYFQLALRSLRSLGGTHTGDSEYNFWKMWGLKRSVSGRVQPEPD